MSIGSSRRKVIAGLLLWPGFARAQFANGISGVNVNGLSLVLGPAGPAVAWTPALLPGLVAWYDAQKAASITLNGSTVSQWNDQSPNAYNMAQGTATKQPTYNGFGLAGKPTLSYRPASTTTYLAAAVPPGAFSTGINWHFVLAGMAGAGAEAPLSRVSAAFFPAPLSRRTNFVAVGDGTKQGYASNAPNVNTYTAATILGCTLDATSQIYNEWQSGTNVYSVNMGPLGWYYSDTETELWNGADKGSASYYTTGLAGEIIASNGALATSDRQQIEGFLAWKWGLAGLLPAGHPYKSGPPDTRGNSMVVPLLTGAESDGTNLSLTRNFTASSLVIAPSITAPDGTTGAVQLLKEDATANLHRFYVATGALTQFTISVYVKAAPGALRYFLMNIVGASTLGASATFDIVNGIINSVAISNSTYTINQVSCQPAANGFFKCLLQVSTTGAFVNSFGYLSTAPTNTGMGAPSYTGDNASGLYLWRIKETTP